MQKQKSLPHERKFTYFQSIAQCGRGQFYVAYNLLIAIFVMFQRLNGQLKNTANFLCEAPSSFSKKFVCFRTPVARSANAHGD